MLLCRSQAQKTKKEENNFGKVSPLFEKSPFIKLLNKKQKLWKNIQFSTK